jgi:hypothetical protein
LLHVSVRSRKLNSYFASKGRQDENLSCSRKPLRALAQIRRRGWDASEGQATPGFKENLKNI